MSSILTRIAAALQTQQIATQISNKANANISQQGVNLALQASIEKLSDTLNEIPFIGLNTQGATVSNNVSTNTVMFVGVPVPVGYKFIVRDFNIVYTTSGGSCNIVIMDYNAKNVINTITSAVSTSSSGFGGTVIDETTCIAITSFSQGVGVVTAYISGVLKKKVSLS